MLTVRDLLASGERRSPDGLYWEPALPDAPPPLRSRLRDAWAVLTGRATAIVPTSLIDIRRGKGYPYPEEP